MTIRQFKQLAAIDLVLLTAGITVTAIAGRGYWSGACLFAGSCLFAYLAGVAYAAHPDPNEADVAWWAGRYEAVADDSDAMRVALQEIVHRADTESDEAAIDELARLLHAGRLAPLEPGGGRLETPPSPRPSPATTSEVAS